MVGWIKIVANGDPKHTRVFDGLGREITMYISRIEFAHEQGQLPTIRITCPMAEASIEGELTSLMTTEGVVIERTTLKSAVREYDYLDLNVTDRHARARSADNTE